MSTRYPQSCPEGFIGHYFVVSGDTMSIIAQYFGTTEEELIAANPHITDPSILYPGDVLCVPGFRKPAACPTNFQGSYEVKAGDTMFAIAQEYNISEEELIAANQHIPNPEFIFPFDILCVPGSLAGLTASALPQIDVNESSNGDVVSLKKGQTLKLSLEENASTGYSWEYKSMFDTNVLEETGSWVQYPKVPEGLTGAPGKRYWTYRALNAGNTTIDLWYIQPWLAEPVPEKTFTLGVNVGPSLQIFKYFS
jgi:predicted secreted protein